MVKILVSGFGPFLEVMKNPTERLATELKNLKIKDKEVESCVLPVSYSKCFVLLQKHIDLFKPDYVICLGVATKREVINLEKVAKNFISADQVDSEGAIQHKIKISSEGDDTLEASLPLDKIQEILNKKSIPFQMSEDAGGYVCNFLMYKSIEYSSAKNIKAGFIHIPLNNYENSFEAIKTIVEEI